jgi:tRNA nucleotidyltransferase (CCA-adding enzyme)
MDVITTHINADFDCLGAMVAARRLYPDAQMIFAGAQERSLREFFLKNPEQAAAFARVRDIDLEAVTRLILVDVRQSERIGPFAAVANRPGVEVHIYDHHPVGSADLHGSLEVIETVGATVTVLSKIFMKKGIDPTPDEATMMMLGLYEDTGNLLFSSTTIEDYRAAAFLFAHGADLNTVSDSLVQELSAEQVALLHELITSRTVLTVKGIEISVAHATVEHFVGDLALLAHKLKDMENLNALLVVVRMADRIFMVGRSRIPEVHVGEILGEFGGGGHAFAASGTCRDQTLVQILERIPQILRERVQPSWEARHLMSTPVKSIARGASINEARELMTRYNLNALPVMDGAAVAGVITRQVADKAAHHGLSEVAVSEYMSGEFASASPTTPIETLQELIVDRNQRLVPVFGEGELVGVITRTDLLRHMVSGARALAHPGAENFAASGSALKKRQVSRLVRDRLPAAIRDLLATMGEVGDAQKVHIFAVGGFVRDLLLGKENLDIDLVIEGDGIGFAREYCRRHSCRVRTHAKFGTAVIIFPDGFKVDIASARMEYYHEPGALPNVEHASIKLDLYRRDFTINTLALALNGDEKGALLDFFGAQRDLHDKVLRVLHNLSFVEDSTRVFRAIRFEQRLGFHIGRQTEQLLRSALRMGFVEKVGGPRLFNELTQILKESNPLPAVERMAGLELLPYIHPRLILPSRVKSLFEEASRALAWYELLYTGEPCQGWLVYFLCLTSSLDEEDLEGLIRRLGIPARHAILLGEQRREVHRLQRVFERRCGRHRPPRPSELHGWLSPLATEALLYFMARVDSDEVRSWISNFYTRLRKTAPLLCGDDLKVLGIPPGPLYKKILKTLLDARLNGKVASREDEILLVKKRFFKV